jgi:Reverse transcriptase (RNA-dependent DNA polymerase).
MSIIEKMSEELVVDINYIKNISYQSSVYYSRYKIKKKNGRERRIFHPSPVLKTFQYWLVNNFFSKFRISDYAFAYRKGYSIKRNAQAHLNSEHILHLDISSFFESITKNHLMGLFNNNNLLLDNLGVTDEDINIILNICLYNNGLTIGSVSSPIISNIVMCSFDEKLRKKLPDEIVYTRYADDMVFSSKNFINNEIISVVEMLLKEYNFSLNKEKTRFMCNKGRRAVTGIIIDDNRVSVGLKKRRKIKSMLYNKLEHGKGNSDEILGHLFYLKDIEPNYFNKIIIKYSTYGNIIEILKNNISLGNDNPYDEVAATTDLHS